MISLNKRYSAGEFLKVMILEERGLTQKCLAEKIRCHNQTISKNCNNKRGITADFALSLEKILGISAETWVTMQSKWELLQARKKAA